AGEKSLQDEVLAAAHHDASAVALDHARPAVEREIAPAEHVGLRLSATTSERPNPGDELGECDRLRQIVVRAELETGDARLKPPGGGDHQNLRARPAPDEGRAQLVPVELGKVAVEHD